jgi:hypothetical protein
MKSPGKKRKTGLERAKVTFRVLLIIGWTVAVVGVALFTYSEAYPKIGQKEHEIGTLTLSQFGFWLIVSGIGLVVISILSSHALTCVLNMARDDEEAVTVHASLGTGYEKDLSSEEHENSPLIGPNKLNYGSTSVSHASPFSSRPRSASVLTSSNSPFSKQSYIAT